MKKSRFTETQIVSILKEANACVPVKEIWCKCGISSATAPPVQCRFFRHTSKRLTLRVRLVVDDCSRPEGHRIKGAWCLLSSVYVQKCLPFQQTRIAQTGL